MDTLCLGAVHARSHLPSAPRSGYIYTTELPSNSKSAMVATNYGLPSSRKEALQCDPSSRLEEQDSCHMALSGLRPPVGTSELFSGMLTCVSRGREQSKPTEGQAQSRKRSAVRDLNQKPKPLIGQMTWDSKLRPLKSKSQAPRTDQQNRVSKITRNAGGACSYHKRQRKFVSSSKIASQ